MSSKLTHWSYFKKQIQNEIWRLLTKLGVSRRFQSVIYPVVHEESESDVQNAQILPENLKNSISTFQENKMFNPIRRLKQCKASQMHSTDVFEGSIRRKKKLCWWRSRSKTPKEILKSIGKGKLKRQWGKYNSGMVKSFAERQRVRGRRRIDTYCINPFNQMVEKANKVVVFRRRWKRACLCYVCWRQPWFGNSGRSRSIFSIIITGTSASCCRTQKDCIARITSRWFEADVLAVPRFEVCVTSAFRPWIAIMLCLDDPKQESSCVPDDVITMSRRNVQPHVSIK